MHDLAAGDIDVKYCFLKYCSSIDIFCLHVSNLFSIHDLAAGAICINTGNLLGMKFNYRYF